MGTDLRRARLVTGALSLVLTLLGMSGVASPGGAFVESPTISAGWGGGGIAADGIVPLRHGHSHNDYEQHGPLSDALERGFTSVEADVWAIGPSLLVGHEVVQAAVGHRTLEELYLDPLRTWVSDHHGSVFADPAVPFTLVVDVKSLARPTYRALDAVLAQYADILTSYGPGGVVRGAVSVVVTGNRARSTMAKQDLRYAAYDGRAAELAADPQAPVSLVPTVSEKWTEHFTWDGKGEMPAAERAELDELVTFAHSQGRRLRLYDTPAPSADARANVWRTELDAGVDLLNVDNLDAGQRFLLAYAQR